MTDPTTTVPSVSVSYARTGRSTKANSLGMRPMQERVYERRGEQYLLIKSPPASGKSRALMFVALDKLANQGVRQAVIVVPERSIGASFSDEPLTQFGFWADWVVSPRWNLCNAPGGDNGGKVNAVGQFLDSDDKVLVCTHATFRFAMDRFGAERFDDRLIAIDEFHHVSADPDSKLGAHLGQLIARERTHIVAMTGSYFRGDAVPVLAPQDEAKFATVTYTYYEQLNGYEHLKTLDIGYYFYSGSYVDDILKVLDPNEKTILHIPNVNSRESTRDKIREVEHILETLGTWEGADPATGFQLVRTAAGRVLRVADLVDDDAAKREKVTAALEDSEQKHNRDHVDIIIALGMAKEGFDWIWCEQALTVGYRSSLTEIVQIIGRATRDAPGKTRARFTNLIAEPDASADVVTEAVNDTLKAIAASLLMEQVLAPKFEFTPKHSANGPADGFEYGADGYDPNKCNVGFNPESGVFQVEIKGLTTPKTEEGRRICQHDLNEVIAAFIQDKADLASGVRTTRRFSAMPDIGKGELFIVGGQVAYVAEVGEEFVAEYGRRDSRLRVIYDNGTESDVLLRSLQRALYRDEAGRRITDPSAGPLFANDGEDGDVASGTIYVLRSQSSHPVVAANRAVLHKIGVTGGDLERRIANAKLDPTFLMADVEIVSTYKLANLNRTKLENLIHRVFDAARLNIEVMDRFGHPIVPREWFLVPLFVIDEAVQKIRDGTIVDYTYEPTEGKLVTARRR